jgi:type II secretory pathway pseudopilin PulG
MTSSFRRVQGMSLISLMIGILISMIGILAGIVLYQNMVKVTIQTRTDAAQDGQLASAMLSLQLELQAAGFGIDKAAKPGPHLVLVEGPPQMLYWRYLNDINNLDSAVCKAFRIQDVDDGKRRQLQLLNPNIPANCTLDVGLAAIVGGWNEANPGPVVLAEFRESEAADAKLPVINITSTLSNCFPYGLGQASNYRMVTITADGAVRRAAIDKGEAAPAVAPLTYNFCIPNIP